MTSLYEFSNEGRLAPVAPVAFDLDFADGRPRWIRMVGAPQEDIETCLHALHLPVALFSPIPAGELRTRIDTHDSALVLTLPVLAPADGRALALHVACTPTTLLTVESEALPGIDRLVRERCSSTGAELTLSTLFVEILEAAASGAAPVYLSLRRALDQLADAVEKRPLDVKPDALLELRHRVSELVTSLEDQSYGVIEVQRRHSHVPSSDRARQLLRDLVADVDRGRRLLMQMEGRLRDLRQHQLHCLEESTNRRLNMLAILSAVYMPATLIAGIYGMNFDHIPITQVPYGYVVVLGVMAVVVCGQLWIFYRRGWFD